MTLRLLQQEPQDRGGDCADQRAEQRIGMDVGGGDPGQEADG
jgi:hypothetical protein